MSSLLHSQRVLYQCSCEEQRPIYSLFYCRHCSAFRCHSCASEEIDVLFCPHCLESNTLGEARLKKNSCVNCNQCPVCETVLSSRTSDGTNIHLVCNVCRWSSKDSATFENPTASNWPVHENGLTNELNQVTERMRSLEAAAKIGRDQDKSIKRRSGPNSYLMADRFGLQAMLQKRKMAMEKPLPTVAVHEAVEIPILDMLVMSDSNIPSFNSIMRQPNGIVKSMAPVRVPLKARKSVRCKPCDHNLVKLDFGPCTIKYKIHSFARNHVPEIRLSRLPAMESAENGFPILLTVSNESDAKTDVLLLPDPESSRLEWLTPMVQLALPPLKDETGESYDTRRIPENGESIVFRRGHTAAIRLDVKSKKEDNEQWLGLLVKFKNDLLSRSNEQPEWNLCRVRIFLQA